MTLPPPDPRLIGTEYHPISIDGGAIRPPIEDEVRLLRERFPEVVSFIEQQGRAESEVAPHPGENHEFRTTCLRCGERGMLHVSLLTPNETVTIAARPALRDRP